MWTCSLISQYQINNRVLFYTLLHPRGKIVSLVPKRHTQRLIIQLSTCVSIQVSFDKSKTLEESMSVRYTVKSTQFRCAWPERHRQNLSCLVPSYCAIIYFCPMLHTFASVSGSQLAASKRTHSSYTREKARPERRPIFSWVSVHWIFYANLWNFVLCTRQIMDWGTQHCSCKSTARPKNPSSFDIQCPQIKGSLVYETLSIW